MKEKILILKSEILKDQERLDNLFKKSEKAYDGFSGTGDYSKLVESAFYVNQIYSGCERIFKNIAKSFENNIEKCRIIAHKTNLLRSSFKKDLKKFLGFLDELIKA